MSSPFSAVKPSAKLSDQVASALEAEIRAGRIQAAQKLPTEAVLAQQFQVATQGGIILAKALNDAAPAREAFDHLERYLRLLFGRPDP